MASSWRRSSDNTVTQTDFHPLHSGEQTIAIEQLKRIIFTAVKSPVGL